MIKFENTEVFNFEGALRGMRNPLNSWDKSDSKTLYYEIDREETRDGDIYATYYRDGFKIGENDLDLARRLIKAGSDHRKFLRQIFVSVDITAPLYWWKEFDTYKVGTVANSCSTMHKIQDKEFTLEDFSTEHLDEFSKHHLSLLLIYLNSMLESFIESKNKHFWYQMIQLLPSSYNQKRTVALNYEVLRNIRNSDRRNHKLDEWRVGFMDWIDSLPYAEELLIGEIHNPK